MQRLVGDVAASARKSGPVGEHELGIQLEQRIDHEAAAADPWMGQRQALRALHSVAEQQHVDVDRARPVACATAAPAELALHSLAGIEQLARLELGLDPQAGVEEVGLVSDLPLRGALVDRRRRRHPDTAAGQRVRAARSRASLSPSFEPSPR